MVSCRQCSRRRSCSDTTCASYPGDSRIFGLLTSQKFRHCQLHQLFLQHVLSRTFYSLPADQWQQPAQQDGSSLSVLEVLSKWPASTLVQWSFLMLPYAFFRSRTVLLLQLSCAGSGATLCGCGSLLLIDAQDWLHEAGVNCCATNVRISAASCRPAVGTQKLGSVFALSVIGH